MAENYREKFKIHYNIEFGSDFEVQMDAKICGSYGLAMMENLVEALDECNKWYDFKMFLDGQLPNIHGLEIH